MNLKATLLDLEHQNRIHQESLRILEQVGVRFYGRLAPVIFQRHGIPFDSEEKIVRLPGEIISWALEQAPKTFLLGARNPSYNFTVPSAVARYAMDGTAAFTRDFYSGERRYGLNRDIADSMRIFQQMDMGVMAWAPVCASDVPANIRPLQEFFSMAAFCSKHGQHEIHRVKQVPFLVAGLAAILGSEDAIRTSQAYSLIYCPVAPLTHDGAMLDAYLESGEYGLPVSIMPMPVTGTTGPASLYSNIILANAEFLATLVVFQLAHPGRPVLYSNATGIMDFRSGGYLAGVPEMGLQSAALVVMGQYYGLPSTSAACTSDAREPGAQAVMEKLITSLPPVLAGADILIGFGEIESDQLLILEQIVVDNEIAHQIQRLAEGIDSREEKILFSDIAAVGPGGHFLKARSTRSAPRSGEFYEPKIIDRQSNEMWNAIGQPSMYSRAREAVERILAEPVQDPLPDETLHNLEEILQKAHAAVPD